MSKVGIGSPVLIRGGDGKKGHILDMVLCTNDPDISLVAYCYVAFEDGGLWQGASHYLVPDPDALHLTFNEHEHRERLMLRLNVDTGKPLNGSEHGKRSFRVEKEEP